MTSRRKGPGGLLLLGAGVVVLAVSAALWLDDSTTADPGEPSGLGAAPLAGRETVLPAPLPSPETAGPAPLEPGAEPLGSDPHEPGGLSPVLRVVDGDGRPVPGADVVVGARREVLMVVGARDMIATARVRNVTLHSTDDEGRCVVRLAHPDSALFARHQEAGTSGVWHAAALFEQPRTDVEPEVELVLWPTAVLSGKAFSREGAPLAGAYVSFLHPEDETSAAGGSATLRARLPAPMRTDGAGRFALQVDAPQTLRVTAAHRGIQTAEVTIDVLPDTFHEVVLVGLGG
jgi:hypothetical protein